jgi:hypothetical protein
MSFGFIFCSVLVILFAVSLLRFRKRSKREKALVESHMKDYVSDNDEDLLGWECWHPDQAI